MVVEREKQGDRNEITGGDSEGKKRRRDNVLGREKQKMKLTEKTGRRRKREK